MAASYVQHHHESISAQDHRVEKRVCQEQHVVWRPHADHVQKMPRQRNGLQPRVADGPLVLDEARTGRPGLDELAPNLREWKRPPQEQGLQHRALRQRRLDAGCPDLAVRALLDERVGPHMVGVRMGIDDRAQGHAALRFEQVQEPAPLVVVQPGVDKVSLPLLLVIADVDPTGNVPGARPQLSQFQFHPRTSFAETALSAPAHSSPQYGFSRGKSRNAPPPRRQLPARGLQGIDDPAAEFITTALPRRLRGLVPVPFYRKSGPVRRGERPHTIPPIRKASQRIRCLPPTVGAKRHRLRASCLTRSGLAGIIPLNSYRNSRAIYSDKLNPASPKGAVPP